MGVVAAERIKVCTSRSAVWCTLLALALGLGLAGLQGGSASVYTSISPGDAAGGATLVGVPLLMVLATMTVTNENRTGMVRTTFQASPNRMAVIAAKSLVAGCWVAAVSAVTTLTSILLVRAMAGSVAGANLDLDSAGVWNTIGAVTVYAFLCAVLAVAVGVLLKHTAGAVAVLLLWPTVLELMLGWFTDAGKALQPFLPFANGIRFTGVPWYTADGVEFVWNTTGSLVYFATVVVIALAAALAVVQRRDV
ncbi:ABC transporter permease [Mycobacterium sp. CBMA271]|uniref:ABC transporter permease n=1 Tax=unclassified Mycobacteroides TaxID=2618759 RepID=UPI0012DDF772|nr:MULTISPECIES: ABC transporter permease [unclassified Mycobacteroides]MUM15378.1 ABC transporter [Mycobacteroides sp. CBMA 326]MUM21279.1 ABC transporter permease [Mycobacteroides sp. CBMA 271]